MPPVMPNSLRLTEVPYTIPGASLAAMVRSLPSSARQYSALLRVYTRGSSAEGMPSRLSALARLIPAG